MNAFRENETYKANPALGLWKRWFRRSGDPMYRGHMVHCFFCGRVQWSSSKKPNHAKDCVYVKAKELLGI